MLNDAQKLSGALSMDLTDEQWQLVKSHLPEPPKRPDGRGRPRVNDRVILNGIHWIMRTGAPWKAMPGRYPSYQTCHRRVQAWVRAGVFEMTSIHKLISQTSRLAKQDPGDQSDAGAGDLKGSKNRFPLSGEGA
jgi:transposase